MADEIKGKVIIVTGASSGIGEETARYLANAGAHVALAARRVAKIKGLEEHILASGGKAKAYPTDVTKKSDVERLVADVQKDFGRVDVFIANAGLMAIAPLEEARTDEWDQMIDINVKGLLYGLAATMPLFLAQGSGHFITVGSVVGLKVFAPGGVAYSATKFAVHAIAEGLRMEAAGRFRVTNIAPGVVDTELKYGTQSATTKGMILDFYKIGIPAEAIARAIHFAISQPKDVDVNEIVVRPTVQDF